MKLFILNKNPVGSSNLTDNLKLIPTGSTLLFYEEGVYAILDKVLCDQLGKTCRVLALLTDTEVRGLTEQIPDAVEMINISDFVALCLSHDCIISIT